jgi:hypothetical protein
MVGAGVPRPAASRSNGLLLHLVALPRRELLVRFLHGRRLIGDDYLIAAATAERQDGKQKTDFQSVLHSGSVLSLSFPADFAGFNRR